MGSSRMDRVPSVDAPPAASTMKAKGAHSYSSLSFAGADALTGLRKMPPPCAKALFLQLLDTESECNLAHASAWRPAPL